MCLIKNIVIYYNRLISYESKVSLNCVFIVPSYFFLCILSVNTKINVNVIISKILIHYTTFTQQQLDT